MRRLRLLMYTDSTGFGGAEMALKHLVHELRTRHDVSVLGVDTSVVQAITGGRVPSTVVRTPRHKFDLPAIREHLAAIRRPDPDVFHANLISPWSCQYGLVLAAVSRIPTVAVYQLPNTPVNRRQRLLKRWTAPLTSAHVAVGESTAHEIEELAGIARGEVRWIHNGVPDLLPAKRQRPSASGFTVGTVARLAPQKGIDVLLRAVAQLPDATLVVAGDGEERPELERLASTLGLAGRVSWLGWVDEPRALIPTFDAFVLPSRFEGFPLSILEAQLAEVPVVASDVGSVAETVRPGSTGLLVPPDDAHQLARALTALADDPAGRRQLGRAGRRLVLERFTASHMAERFERLYAELVR